MHVSLHVAGEGSSLELNHAQAMKPVPRWEGLADAAVIVKAERDAKIVTQGDRAEHCFLVISGWLRTVTLMGDGRRHVGEFFTEGDLFGWDVAGQFDVSAEAVTPVTLGRVGLRTLELLAEHDAGVARRLRHMGTEQLRRGRRRMILLGRMTAQERIASFLGEMSARGQRGGTGLVPLPMNRADIADHLGLTVETVCRGLAHLRRIGALRLERQGFRILDHTALCAARAQSLR
jgi:CRP/FNR family nitrogen fixation transcriptional regulator